MSKFVKQLVGEMKKSRLVQWLRCFREQHKRSHGCWLFGPEYGIQLEIHLPSWPVTKLGFQVGGGVWWGLGGNMSGCHMNLGIIGVIIFHEYYEGVAA